MRRTVHAAGDTANYLAALRASEQARYRREAASREVYTDPHDAVAASGANAARLAEARRVDLERMRREQEARLT